jgi:hypothetical protein
MMLMMSRKTELACINNPQAINVQVPKELLLTVWFVMEPTATVMAVSPTPRRP